MIHIDSVASNATRSREINACQFFFVFVFIYLLLCFPNEILIENHNWTWHADRKRLNGTSSRFKCVSSTMSISHSRHTTLHTAYQTTISFFFILFVFWSFFRSRIFFFRCCLCLFESEERKKTLITRTHFEFKIRVRVSRCVDRLILMCWYCVILRILTCSQFRISAFGYDRHRHEHIETHVTAGVCFNSIWLDSTVSVPSSPSSFSFALIVRNRTERKYGCTSAAKVVVAIYSLILYLM